MLVIRGATVYPGEGEPAEVDVGIADGQIAAVGGELSGEIVEADGLWLCPGFIDVHAHTALRSYEDPLLIEVLSQGVTTQVICPDGLAPAPVAAGRWEERRDYLRALEGPGPDEWPWSTLRGVPRRARRDAAGDLARPLDRPRRGARHRDRRRARGRRRRAELEEMRREVRAGFEAGATNLSFGLVYLPGAHADTDELVAVAEVAAEFGKPIVPHVRNEGDGLLEAIDEMLEVSRRSGASLHLSHLKSFADEGLIEPLLEKVEGAGRQLRPVPLRRRLHPAREPAARVGAGGRRGGDARADARPAGGRADRARRRARPRGLGEPARDGRAGPDPGRRREHRRPRRRAGRDGRGPAARVRARRADGHALRLRGGGPDDRRAPADAARLGRDLRPPSASAGGGQRGALPGPALPAEGMLAPEEAIARLTARAADRFGLADRGRIEVGKRADLVLLDPASYVDTATYEQPLLLAEGVAGVWVAGERAWADGAPTGARAGGVVR